MSCTICTHCSYFVPICRKVQNNKKFLLLKFRQNLRDVVLRRKPDHDVQLLQLDVDGVVVLDEEDLHLVLEYIGALLDDQVDVAKCDVLNFRLGREESDQWWGQLLAQVGHEISVLKMNRIFLQLNIVFIS